MKKSLGMLQVLADFFATYLPVTKELSENTIISYQYAFQMLFEYLYAEKGLRLEKVTFQNLENGTITEFLNWLETNRNCSASTRNQRLAAISSFAKYAMRQNLTTTLSFGSEVANIPKKKVPKNDDVVYFTAEEISVLLRMPDNTTKTGKRDTVLMSVLYASGARAQELCDLTVNDVRFGEKTALRLVGKGNKARTITIPEDCSLLLRSHLKRNQLDTATRESRLRHVFSSQLHEHMTISCIEEIVKKYVKTAKTARPDLFRHESYTPHSFRHSIAVHMLESGVPVPVIKNFLGHSSIESTMIYATVTPELANKYLRERSSLAKTPEFAENEELPVTPLPFLRKFTKK